MSSPFFLNAFPLFRSFYHVMSKVSRLSSLCQEVENYIEMDMSRFGFFVCLFVYRAVYVKFS